MKTEGEDKGTDIEAAIDDSIGDQEALARRHLIGSLEEVLQDQTIKVIRSPGAGTVSLKTATGSTVMFAANNKGNLEVSIAYNRKSEI